MVVFTLQIHDYGAANEFYHTIMANRDAPIDWDHWENIRRNFVAKLDALVPPLPTSLVPLSISPSPVTGGSEDSVFSQNFRGMGSTRMKWFYTKHETKLMAIAHSSKMRIKSVDLLKYSATGSAFGC